MTWPLLLVVVAVSRATSVPDDTRFAKPDKLKPAPDDLQYAFIMFRHGIRSPNYNMFLSDEDYKKKWPNGMGALTEAGKRLMLHVGESLKKRYQCHVPGYDVNRVQITSTNLERTKMSAMLVAAGMFPAEDHKKDGISNKEPIPILQDVVDYDKDMLYGLDDVPDICPRFTELRNSVLDEEDTWNITKNLRMFYSRINKQLAHNNSRFTNVNSLTKCAKVWDTFEMERRNLKPIPEWVDSYMIKWTQLAHLRIWSFINAKESMNQFFAGPLFHQILQEMTDQSLSSMDQNLAEEDKKVKLHLHGSHDTSVGAVFWVLTGNETYYALAGNTIILELYKNETVKMFHYSPLEVSSDKRFQQISLRHMCMNDTCSLSELRCSLKYLDISEDEWKVKCNESLGEPAAYHPWPITFKDT